MTSLQIIWFFLIGVLLVGYAILDGFDLGVGFWHLFTKKDKHRRTFLKAIGPVWDGNEVWLLTGGGAIFAAFPPVYASVFSGFYLALMLVLLGLIFRAVAIEFRNKIESKSWRARWDVAFSLGSILPALLFGVALGNIVRGLELDASGNYIGGFLALLNPYALLIGLTGLAMFALHGAIFLTMKTEGELQETAKGWALKAWPVYLVLFLASAIWSLAAYQHSGLILATLAGLAALAAIILGRSFLVGGSYGKAFIASSVAIASQFAAAAASIFPNIVPAIGDASLSLTVFNSSSSQYTLTVMLIMALIGMPLVLGYTIYIYRLFAGKVTITDSDY